MSDPQKPPQFPSYAPPTALPTASRDQAKPLQKIIRTMFKARKLRSQSKPRTRKKTKFY